jgi:uncharacterized SAM-binding protein YcdF (DUF218 family)
VLIEIGAGVFLLLSAAGVLHDRRRFRNAVLLGIAIMLAGTALLLRLADHAPLPVLDAVTLALLLVPALGGLALAALLVASGVQLLRREGVRLTNLLALAAGVGILVFGAVLATTIATQVHPLEIAAGALLLVLAYVSFLFACFLGYGFLYGRIGVRGDVDFVVVLGAGLVRGSRVTPLLAGRLDRARTAYERQAARGTPPVIVTSGGQGPDEDLPEADAMAAYLIERGVPEARVVREDRSRSTRENLAFSRVLMEERKPGGRCVIVTNNFHVFRAAMTAGRVGVRGQVVGSRTASYYWPSATIREFVAVFLTPRWLNPAICAALAALGVAAWWRV